MRRLVNVLGVPVDDVTMRETVDRVAELIEAGRAHDQAHQVATVNVDFVVNARRDSRLMSLLQGVSLSLPDGMPIVWASRVLGTRLRERVAGADLVEALAERAAVDGYRMYLFGSAPGVATRAADLLLTRFPSIQIVADAGPLVGADGTMDVEHLSQIRAARPDIVCVALGNPKQEFWIGHYGCEVGAPVLIGVGGSLDILVGDKRRAPAWMQRVGLEWVFRASQEPGRLVKRYATDLRSYFPPVTRQAWIGRRRGTPAAAVRVVGGPDAVISLSGAPTFDDLEGCEMPIDVVEAAGLAIPDNATTDLLVSMSLDARRRGRGLVVRDADVRVRQRLGEFRVEELFRFEPGDQDERSTDVDVVAETG